MRLVDSHCHLQADAFAPDLEPVLDAAIAAGVERILVPGWDLASSRGALELVERHAWLDAAVGVHPHAAADTTEGDWAAVVALARHRRVVALGETGLDLDRRFSPLDDQLANLRRHLRLGLETGTPVILHCRSAPGSREAQDLLLAELRAAGYGGAASAAAFGARPPAVLHSFSGPLDYGRAALDLGLAIAIGGLAFRAGEEPTAEVAPLVPGERLLLETDSPWLAPPGAPRRRNAPEWVRVVAAWLAERRGTTPAALGDAVVAAYDATFRRSVPRPGAGRGMPA